MTNHCAAGLFLFRSTHASIAVSDEALKDFQSTVLKEEWEKRQQYLLARGNKRRMEDLKRKEELKQHMEQFRLQNDVVQAQLDESRDQLMARFADQSVEMEHTIKKLEQSHANKMKFEEKKPCLQERANLSVCFKNDPEACSDFVEALDHCVTKTLVKE